MRPFQSPFPPFYRFLPLLILSLLLITRPALSQETEAADDAASRYQHYFIHYVVHDDGTTETTEDYAVVALKQSAVPYLKQASVSYSTTAEKLDIIEAYTLKPDGKKIPAPKDNFQLQVESGKDKASPAFSDETTLTILFPDVEVGDSVHLAYKTTETEALFPKKFSIVKTFSKTYGYDDAEITLDMPTSLAGKYLSFGLGDPKISGTKDHRSVAWSWKNLNPPTKKPSGGEIYNFEDGVGILASNFASYGEIAAAYGARATPKAAVTPQIAKLADEITKDKTSPRDQTKALYDWVTKNISYAGNCIGIGSVVPRDLDFVLGNKIGDCKDHATLLEALLSAKKIESSQALIDAGRIYHLPKLPVVSIVNHVINYVPGLNLYLDSTNHTPFGLLPAPLYGKPVLLVDGFKEGMTTPPPPKTDPQMKLDQQITIGEDGSAKGSLKIELKGESAFAASEAFKDLTKQHEKDWLEKLVKRGDLEGTLQVERGSYNEDNLTYSYTFQFELKHFVHAGSPGALYVYPLFAQSLISAAIRGAFEEQATKEFLCGGGVLLEQYVYKFPQNIKLLATPDALTAQNATQTYVSSYVQNGQDLTVMRRLDDKTDGPTCKPEMDAVYKEIAEKALPDIKAQLVYK